MVGVARAFLKMENEVRSMRHRVANAWSSAASERLATAKAQARTAEAEVKYRTQVVGYLHLEAKLHAIMLANRDAERRVKDLRGEQLICTPYIYLHAAVRNILETDWEAPDGSD